MYIMQVLIYLQTETSWIEPGLHTPRGTKPVDEANPASYIYCDIKFNDDQHNRSGIT